MFRRKPKTQKIPPKSEVPDVSLALAATLDRLDREVVANIDRLRDRLADANDAIRAIHDACNKDT